MAVLTLDQAKAVSEVVASAFDTAKESLAVCFVNGAGVLSDPSTVRRDLMEAKSAIDEALAALNGVPAWPGNEAYD